MNVALGILAVVVLALSGVLALGWWVRRGQEAAGQRLSPDERQRLDQLAEGAGALKDALALREEARGLESARRHPVVLQEIDAAIGEMGVQVELVVNLHDAMSALEDEAAVAALEEKRRGLEEELEELRVSVRDVVEALRAYVVPDDEGDVDATARAQLNAARMDLKRRANVTRELGAFVKAARQA
jgi:hypothetical protein